MKRVLILGFGKSGKAVYHYLKDTAVQVSIYDEQVKDAQLDMYTLSRLKKELPLFDMAIRSPGISMCSEVYQLCRLLCKEVISEIEFAYRLLKKKHPIYIAVTGTNGKTTLCTMIYEILSRYKEHVYLAGNIGTPLTSYIHTIEQKSIVILEVSSFQLENIVQFRPDFAILTNIDKNHLDEVYDYSFYQASKKRLTLSMDMHQLLFYHRKDASFFHLTTANAICIEDYCHRHHIHFQQLLLPGEHNIQHAMTACMIGDIFGIPFTESKQIIETLLPLPYRMERIDVPYGGTIINDSKSTNVASTNQCLRTFLSAKRILILGGIAKSDDFQQLEIRQEDQIFAYGSARFQIQSQLPQAILYETLDEIIDSLKRFLKEGYDILFSPACSSFDQFDNYLVRGAYFTKRIKELFL